ncbi:phosphopantetheine-binding protein [Streptomyces stramineus]
MDALPLTGAGKVDRAALSGPAAPDTAAPDTATPAEAPSEELSPLQAVVAAAWSRALGEDVTHAAADFFDLGGHSLLALGIVDDLSEDLGVELTLAAFFETPTVAGQAALLGRALAAVHDAPPEGGETR